MSISAVPNMGLGNFRFRIILILIAIIIFGFWLRLSSTFNPIIFRIYVQEDNQNEAEIAKIVQEDNVQKVLVTVYYESLCPDSRSFFLQQLMPTYQRIPENIIIEFVPYGNAKTMKTDNGYKFECQHGPDECEANIIHACSIEHIKNQDQVLDYLSCMIKDNENPVSIMEQCAQKLNVDIKPIIECSRGLEGKNLLAHYGKMTDNLVPKVSFIPTVTLDKSSNNQPGILKNLLQQVCLKLKSLPKSCE